MKSPLRLLLASLCVCLLSSCFTAGGERQQVRKVVVANYVKPSLARVRVGFTAFGNKSAVHESVPGLEFRLQQAVKTVTQQHFAEVVHLDRPPTPPERPNAWTDFSVIYGEFSKALATRHHADAVLLILPRPMAPYGVPQYMAAEGPAVYVSGAAMLPYVGMEVQLMSGLTGRRFFPGLSAAKRKVAIMPWKDHFSDYTATEQQVLVDEAVQAFSERLDGALEAQGFKAQGANKPPPSAAAPSQPDWGH